jgi:glycosyltransferase involved in cell wall biosynthesis
VNVDLHIVGPVPDTEYANRLKSLAEENSSWLSLVGGLYGDNKLDFLAQFKYAIHGRDNEAFGIAVSELVKAGCIVWVPEGGGQMEIVNHPMLTYRNEADAVEKITQVLSSETLQHELREHLKKQARLFSSDRFMVEMKKIVDSFFEK